MAVRLWKTLPTAAASGLAAMALAVPAASAQWNNCQPLPALRCPPSPCPSPMPAITATPGQEGQTPSAQAMPSAEPFLGAEQASAAGGNVVSLAAPNMLGNLLGAGRSIAFFYQRSSGSVFINGTGSTSIVNPKVADNNSPLPMDRVSFRYNYFNDSLKVTGDSGQKVFDPSLGVSSLSGPRFRGITATRNYDVSDYTFSGEKTFFDRLFSVEVRVPFGTSLSHRLDLSVARITSIGKDEDNDSAQSVLGTTATPEDTLGHSATEFGNMTVVLKALAYQSRCMAFSGGLSIGIPTAPDTRVRVTDFLGDAADNDIEVQRRREFRIANDTWALSPFLAVLFTPSDRLFAQGFMQFDFPVNKSGINYYEFASINTEPEELSLSPISVSDSIRDQTLMQTDIGIGYWVIKNRRNAWITGMAPTLELHYTTTLNDASIVTLPTAPRTASLSVVGPNGQLIPEPGATVGNLRNRIDILDMTVGNTLVIGDRATLATGVAFPLKTGDDRTFSWELQVQFNYYFGGGKSRATPVVNLQ